MSILFLVQTLGKGNQQATAVAAGEERVKSGQLRLMTL